ncbi:MAG TPA: GNAT family N-acetyltransferase [Rubrivivax sp.]|jgi:putative acetyltransferase|nr:GNAT family N-acetyltransferase [Rubrivivax sp.]
MELRLATECDVRALSGLYARAARAAGPAVYDDLQVQAWASFAESGERFRDYVLGARTWVAEREGRLIAFCGIDQQSELRSLYVAPEWQRQGLGRHLLRHVLQDAAAAVGPAVRTWATPLSRPLFESEGFRLVEVRSEPYQGVVFERYRLERRP